MMRRTFDNSMIAGTPRGLDLRQRFDRHLCVRL